MSEKFPEQIPKKDEPVWATLVPYRTPEFKVHSSEGLANNALGQRRTNETWAKYKLINGVWVRVLLYTPPTECESCGKDISNGERHRARGYTPAISAPVVCWLCYLGTRD